MSATIEVPIDLAGSYLAAVFDPITDEFDYCEFHGLLLSPARLHGWLVRRKSAGADVGVVVACIEPSENEFELMQVDSGFRWSIHDSLHDALVRVAGDHPVGFSRDTLP
jgi:hypothetical protein